MTDDLYPAAFVKGDAERIAYDATDAVNLRAHGYTRRPAVETSPALDLAKENTGNPGPVAPPLGGPGSGIAEWRTYAEQLDVDVDGLDTREQIVDAIDAAAQPAD